MDLLFCHFHFQIEDALFLAFLLLTTLYSPSRIHLSTVYLHYDVGFNFLHDKGVFIFLLFTLSHRINHKVAKQVHLLIDWLDLSS